MFNLLEKSFIIGLGALSVTKNTAEKYVAEAIKQCKMSPDEGNTFLKTFSEEGEKAKKQLEDTVAEILKTRGQSLLPCHKKVTELEERVKELEAKLAAMENKE